MGTDHGAGLKKARPHSLMSFVQELAHIFRSNSMTPPETRLIHIRRTYPRCCTSQWCHNFLQYGVGNISSIRRVNAFWIGRALDNILFAASDKYTSHMRVVFTGSYKDFWKHFSVLFLPRTMSISPGLGCLDSFAVISVIPSSFSRATSSLKPSILTFVVVFFFQL